MGGTAHRLEGEKPSKYEQHSRVIECPSSVLHELRATVLERFNSLPHGGSEIFGVLFGTHNEADVHITGFRALITDHEFAHPGELSDEECAAFASAMPARPGDADASPVAAVGWFRSHPRSRLTLSERDLEIANTLFPQPWQVTLILRPGNSATTRARVFFRETEAPLTVGAGYQEFTVDPPQGGIGHEFAEPAAALPPVTEGSDTAAPMADPPVAAAPIAAAPVSVPANGGDPDGPVSTAAPAEHAVRPAALPRDLESWGRAPEPAPSILREPPPPLRDRRIATPWTTMLRWPAALATIAGVVIALYWFGRPQGLALRVFDTNGQLRILWNRDAKPVSEGRTAHLEINDGGARVWVELDGEQLRDGNVTYQRHSSNVAVRLVVPREGETPVEEVARFLGPAGQPAGAQEPQSGSASRVISPAPGDSGPQGTAELVVAVPVEPAEPVDAEARPKFTAPPVALPASKPSAAPDLTPPPAVARETSAATPTMRAQLAVEKLAPPQIPTASAPVASAPPSAAIVPPPVQTPVRPAPAAHTPAVQPASGRVIWIGRLQKNQTLIIKGRNSSTGTLIGELPSQPVKFSLSPGDLSSEGIVLYTSNSQYANNVVEPPGSENGWNRTIYTWNPKFASDVSVQETPSAQNGWSGVLRSRNPKISVIVIDWAVVN